MSLTPRRAVAFVGVLALHAMGLRVLIESRLEAPPTAQDFTSTLIVLPADSPPTAGAGKQPLQPANTRIHSEHPHLSIPDSMESSSSMPAPAIDWAAEAHREGTAITQTPTVTEFGQIPHAEGEGKALPSAPAQHYAGQQYRDEFGESIVWVSERCYLVSESAPPDLPRGSIPTRTICVGDSGQPRGDLFKDLPAYAKYHDE
jgi:hypothetical protein